MTPISTRFGLAALCSAFVLLLTAAPAFSAPTLPTNFRDDPVTALDRPTGLAFTPDGRLLVAGQAGTVNVFRNGTLQQPPALDISAKTCSDQERGMMAVAVDPSLRLQPLHLRLLHVEQARGVCEYGSNGSTRLPVNRVSRFVLADNDTVDEAGEAVLIDNIPAPEGYHIGADLHFGKDGYLYVSTGDGGCDYAEPVVVRRLQRRRARPERPARQGAADHARRRHPGEQPVPGRGQRALQRHRDAPTRERSARRHSPGACATRSGWPSTPTPRARGSSSTTSGDITWEEVDLGQAGADYGWNFREGPCATRVDHGLRRSAGRHDESDPRLQPRHRLHVDHRRRLRPERRLADDYDGAYLYGDLVCGKMFRLTPAAGGGYTATEFASGFGAYSLVSMTFGPSGTGQALYYITLNPSGQVRRISYTGAPRGHARPKSATPVFVSLVPAYRQCTAASRVHAPPLGGSSCTPAQESSQLTVGTADANGKAPGSGGYTQFRLLPDNMSTPADESDVALVLNIDRHPPQGGPDRLHRRASGRDHDPPDRQVQRPVGDRRCHDDGLLAGLPLLNARRPRTRRSARRAGPPRPRTTLIPGRSPEGSGRCGSWTG